MHIDYDINEFHAEIIEKCNIAFYSDKNTTLNQIFINKFCEYLEEDGDLINTDWTDYEQTTISFSGYAYDKERNDLAIVGCNFFGTQDIKTFTKQMYLSKFKKLKNFFIKSIDTEQPLHKNMSPSDDACESSRNIYEFYKNNKIHRLRFIILTDGLLTKNTKQIPSEKINNIKSEFQIYDIKYLYNIINNPIQPIVIDFKKDYNIDGIECLKAPILQSDYSAYLLVIPAIVLANIYDKYGQRLLEQNVRTFLQFRKQVNKGMLATIKSAPHRFFAYNNGLTCTALSINTETSSTGKTIIQEIKGLQIVNGGQTSSVIYRSFRDGYDLSEIFVQIKLSILNSNEDYDDFVGKVARYANSQNPVKESDFFSNSPFHKDFKDLSEKIRVKPKNGEQFSTYWFYERTRGQYLNEKSKYQKGSKKEKEFLYTYPNNQILDKQTLAKVEMAFLNMPYRSAKINDAFPHFTEYIKSKLDDDKLAINEAWYKESIAKVIIFRDYEKILLLDEWVKERKSVRAYIKAYTISLLYEFVKSKNLYFDFVTIWEQQTLSNELIDLLNICLNSVKKFVSSLEIETDLREKLKKESTWRIVKEIPIDIPDAKLRLITRETEDIKTIHKEEKNLHKLDDRILAQQFVVNFPHEKWELIFYFYKNNIELCGIKKLKILKNMVDGEIITAEGLCWDNYAYM